MEYDVFSCGLFNDRYPNYIASMVGLMNDELEWIVKEPLAANSRNYPDTWMVGAEGSNETAVRIFGVRAEIRIQ